jgi:hypothetical protein
MDLDTHELEGWASELAGSLPRRHTVPAYPILSILFILPKPRSLCAFVLLW